MYMEGASLAIMPELQHADPQRLAALAINIAIGGDDARQMYEQRQQGHSYRTIAGWHDVSAMTVRSRVRHVDAVRASLKALATDA